MTDRQIINAELTIDGRRIALTDDTLRLISLLAQDGKVIGWLAAYARCGKPVPGVAERLHRACQDAIEGEL